MSEDGNSGRPEPKTAAESTKAVVIIQPLSLMELLHCRAHQPWWKELHVIESGDE